MPFPLLAIVLTSSSQSFGKVQFVFIWSIFNSTWPIRSHYILLSVHSAIPPCCLSWRTGLSAVLYIFVLVVVFEKSNEELSGTTLLSTFSPLVSLQEMAAELEQERAEPFHPPLSCFPCTQEKHGPVDWCSQGGDERVNVVGMEHTHTHTPLACCLPQPAARRKDFNQA